MSASVRSVIAVWLLLMLGTAASTWGLSLTVVVPPVSTIAIMLISALKVGLVMTFFMGLRKAPAPWQRAGTIWVVGATSTVLIIYLL